jgi:hypothetical protein
MAAFAVLGVLLFAGRRRRRLLTGCLLMLMMFAAATALSGCGGSPATYKLTITGSGANTIQTVAVVLAVQ